MVSEVQKFILYSAGLTAFRPVTRKTSNQNSMERRSAQCIASGRQRERERNQDKVYLTYFVLVPISFN